MVNLVILASLALASVISVVLLFKGLPFHQTSPQIPQGSDDYETLPLYFEEPFYPMKRYSLGYDNVACWQNEGVWIGNLHPLDMRALGINRFQDTDRSLNQTEEDAFCAVLRTYGANFYSLPPRWPYLTLWAETIDGTVKPAIQVDFDTCFPETGRVRLLGLTKGGGYTYLGLENAVTIGGRCEIFEKMGAKFCESMQDLNCPETDILVDKIEYEDREGACWDERSCFLPDGKVIGGWDDEDCRRMLFPF